MVPTDMLWPVYGKHGTLAWFLDYGAAVAFVNSNLGKRNLYIGEPEYQDEVRALELGKAKAA